MTVNMNDSLRNTIVEKQAGFILQSNFHSLGEVMFSYYLEGFQHDNAYNTVVAKFNIKPLKNK
jgi:hypothetical protein